MKTRITVSAYPPSVIPEHYYPIRDMGKCCLICQHYTAPCDLRQSKRFIVQLNRGFCRLHKTPKNCPSFERLEELRGRNMTPLEKVYARHYTFAYLRKIFRWFHADIRRLHQHGAEKVACMIALYEKSRH